MRTFSALERVKMAQLIEKSLCNVVLSKQDGEMKALRIQIAGPLAHFPSSSNSKAIGYRFIMRGRQKVKVPTIRSNDSHAIRFEALTDLVTAELLDRGLLIPFPSFLTEHVTVLAMLAQRPGRWDSHNQSKPIGDWLQRMGIITDDSLADIYCLKRAHLPHQEPHLTTTTLTIVPTYTIKADLLRFIDAFYKVAFKATSNMVGNGDI